MFRKKRTQTVALGFELQIKIVIVSAGPQTGVETGPKGSAIDDFGIPRRRRDRLVEKFCKVRQQTLARPFTKKALVGRIECDACHSRWSRHAQFPVTFPP